MVLADRAVVAASPPRCPVGSSRGEGCPAALQGVGGTAAVQIQPGSPALCSICSHPPAPGGLLGKQIPFMSVALSHSQVFRVVFGRGAGSVCGPKPDSLCKREVRPACLPCGTEISRVDKGLLSAPLPSVTCHRGQVLVTCPGTADSA